MHLTPCICIAEEPGLHGGNYAMTVRLWHMQTHTHNTTHIQFEDCDDSHPQAPPAPAYRVEQEIGLCAQKTHAHTHAHREHFVLSLFATRQLVSEKPKGGAKTVAKPAAAVATGGKPAVAELPFEIVGGAGGRGGATDATAEGDAAAEIAIRLRCT